MNAPGVLGDPGVLLPAAHHDGSGRYVERPDPSPGDRVTVFVRTPGSVGKVYVRSVIDGEPRFEPARLDRVTGTRRCGTEPSPGAGPWPGAERWWRAEVEVRHPVTRYRFLLLSADGSRWLSALGVVGHDVPDAFDFRLVAYPAPPAWATDAVIYQVFPDRFARSQASARHPESVGRHPVPDWAIPCRWDDPVIARGPETPRQLYGGDLDGVAAKLDHLGRLGATALYLTPVFPGRSNHRYDASAFDAVDPLLGGDAALRRLAGAARARGIRLLGDLTTNHCGAGHPWFRAASASPGAPEREMFYFTPDGQPAYWCGVPSLPKFNWGSRELRRRFLTGPDAVATRWLDVLDGWRVDVANMTGRYGADDHTHEIAAALRRAVAAVRPDALLVAEHGHDASEDLDRDGWHGTMNYAGFTRPLWCWLRADELRLPDFLGVPDGVPRWSARAAVAAMRLFSARVSWRASTHSWALLGSHDTARIRTVVGSPAAQEVAAGLLFTGPGVPMVFAGDEIGLTGHNGEASRTPMPWHRPETWDSATLSRYTDLIALRRSTPALRLGGLRWAYAGGDAVAYLRDTPDEEVLVLARRASGPALRLPGLAHWRGAENRYGGADLTGDAEGVVLPGDGPTFQVWRRPG